MGCCNSTEEIKPELESKVAMAEYALGMSKINSGSFKRIIFRYTNKGNVSYEQLNMIFRHLQLEKTDPLRKYIEIYYRIDQNFYDSKKMIAAGVILGADSTKTKCKILFDTFSTEPKEIMECKDVELMIKTIIDISFNINLRYSIAFYELHEEDTASKLKGYRRLLRKLKSEICDSFTADIMKSRENIASHDFFKAFRKIDLNLLLDSHILRVYSLMSDKELEKKELAKEKILEDSDEEGSFRKSLTMLINFDSVENPESSF